MLTAALPISAGWERGVTFSTPSCIAPLTVGFCFNTDNGDSPKVTSRPSELATFQTFGIVQAVECSTMGSVDVERLAEQALDVTREFAVARELLSGAASSNANLGDATDMGTAADPVNALGCLDQTAAEALSGRTAYIHASPAIGAAWLAASAIWRDGNVWRTALGSVVVISAGYDGRSPGGGAPVAGESLYAYVTGEVYAMVGRRETRGSVERTVNTAHAYSEEVGIAVFDPCFVAAVDTTVELCQAAS